MEGRGVGRRPVVAYILPSTTGEWMSRKRLSERYIRRHEADWQLMREARDDDWDEGKYDDPRAVRYGPHDWEGLEWVLSRADDIDDGVRRFIQLCVVPRYRGYDADEWRGPTLEEYCRRLCEKSNSSTDWRDAIDSCEKEKAESIGHLRSQVEGFL